jgi:hypothetical protein
MRSRDGQAAADYAAVLLVVAAVLAVAGAVAVPGVGERVVAAVRTGICIVGGDICRDADARAAGLSPCITRDRTEGGATAVDIAVLRVGSDSGWTVAHRSDGSVVITRTTGDSLGASSRFGTETSFRPIGLALGADGRAGVVHRDGRSWRFPSIAAARPFLAAALGPDPDPYLVQRVPPDERWDAWGAQLEAEAGASAEGRAGDEVAVSSGAGGRIAVEGLVGERTGGGRTTRFYRATLEGPEAFAGLPGWSWSSDGAAHEALVEVTSDGDGLRELVVRRVAGRGDRVEEVTGRLDLRDPEVRAGLERLRPGALELLTGGPVTLKGMADGLAELAAEHGIVERQAHAVDDRSTERSAAVKLGLALGFEHTSVDIRSRLTDASVWIAGAGPRRREDCLGP